MGKTYGQAIRRRRRAALAVMGVSGTTVITVMALATNLAIALAVAVWTLSCWWAGGQYGYLLGRDDALIVATRNQHRRRLNGN